MSQRPPSSFTQATAGFADLIIDGPRETWPLRGSLDLADEFWPCVEIGANGWRDQDEILFAAARPSSQRDRGCHYPPRCCRSRYPTDARTDCRGATPAAHALWREFELARPHILGALLDAAAHGLRMLPQVCLKRLPRMADFALWAIACESAFRPTGTVEAAYSNNRRNAIENIVDADPVAACVREIMADRAQWTGSASDLLQVGTNRLGARARWPAGYGGHRPFLRTLGITAIGENQLHDTVSTVSRVSDNEHGAGLSHPRPDWNRRFKCRRC